MTYLCLCAWVCVCVHLIAHCCSMCYQSVIDSGYWLHKQAYTSCFYCSLMHAPLSEKKKKGKQFLKDCLYIKPVHNVQPAQQYCVNESLCRTLHWTSLLPHYLLQESAAIQILNVIKAFWQEHFVYSSMEMSTMWLVLITFGFQDI